MRARTALVPALIALALLATACGGRTSGMAGGAGREASLAIELRDPKSERTMWYGTVEQTWHDDMNVKERVHTAVSLLLDSYPPGGKDLRKGSESVQE